MNERKCVHGVVGWEMGVAERTGLKVQGQCVQRTLCWKEICRRQKTLENVHSAWSKENERKTEERQGQTLQGPACVFRFIKALLLYSKRNQNPLVVYNCCDAVKLVLTVIWRDQSESHNGCFLLVKELLPAST